MYKPHVFYLHLNKHKDEKNCGIFMSVEETSDTYGPRCLILAGADYLQWDNEYSFVQAQPYLQQKLQALFLKNRDNPEFTFTKEQYRMNYRIPNVLRANHYRLKEIRSRQELLYLLQTKDFDIDRRQEKQLIAFYEAMATNSLFTPLQTPPTLL